MENQQWKYSQKAEDSWQVLRMQSEFIKGFDELSELSPCISVFGSARTKKVFYLSLFVHSI